MFHGLDVRCEGVRMSASCPEPSQRLLLQRCAGPTGCHKSGQCQAGFDVLRQTSAGCQHV